jgi:hypothetical protein
LAHAPLRLSPPLLHQGDLGLAADEGHQTMGAGDLQTTADAAVLDGSVDADRICEPFQPMAPKVYRRKVALNEPSRGCTHDRGIGRGECLQSGRDVGRFAQG